MKKILIALVLIVVLGIVLLIGLIALGVSKIDDIFKYGIEQGGTYATGVETTVDTVEVGLFDGTFGMSGFQLANPDGFTTPHFLALGGTSVQIDTEDMSTQNLTLSTLTLSDIDLYLDQGGEPSNYGFVLDSLKRFESGDAPKPESETGGYTFVIESLLIENVDVHLANMPGVSLVAGDVAVNVPQIELQNVGADEPMTFGEVIGLVVKTVLAASVQAGGGIIPADVLGQLQGGLGSLESLQDMGIDAVGEFGEQLEAQLGGVTEQAEQVIDDVKQAGEDLQNQVEDATKQVEDAAEGIKDLFGGGKKDDP